MPLSRAHTHKAFDKNFHKLLKEGYPIKQSLAISYAVMKGRDKNMKKFKKLAEK